MATPHPGGRRPACCLASTAAAVARLRGKGRWKGEPNPRSFTLLLGMFCHSAHTNWAREGNNTEGPVPPRVTFSLHGPACLGLGRPNGTAAAKRGGVMQCVVVRWSGWSDVAIEASLGSGDGLWHQFRGVGCRGGRPRW
jgi:hypothetical protein